MRENPHISHGKGDEHLELDHCCVFLPLVTVFSHFSLSFPWVPQTFFFSWDDVETLLRVGWGGDFNQIPDLFIFFPLVGRGWGSGGPMWGAWVLSVLRPAGRLGLVLPVQAGDALPREAGQGWALSDWVQALWPVAGAFSWAFVSPFRELV